MHLDHCVIAVSDWERSNRFYADVLGAELARGAQGHHGRGRILAIARLQRRLQGPQLVWCHGHLLRFLERRYTGPAGETDTCPSS